MGGGVSVDASTKPNVVKGSYVTLSFNSGSSNILEWGFCDINGNNYEKQTAKSFYMPAKDIFIKIVSTHTAMEDNYVKPGVCVLPLMKTFCIFIH